MNLEYLYQVFIPGDLKKDDVEFTYAKNFLATVLVSFFAAPFYAILYYYLNFTMAVIVIVVAEIIMLASVFIFKYTRSLLFASSIFIFTLVCLLYWLTYSLGGLYTPTSYWFILPPLIATFIGGISAGAIWCLLCFIAVTSIYLLEYFHFNFPSNPVTNPLLLQYIAISGLVIVIMVLANFFEIGKRTGIKKLRFLAYHDSLTKLPNRFGYNEILENAINKAKKYHTSFSILHLNLDNFKVINDTYGQDVGDLLLKVIVKRIKHDIRHTDSMSRLGGDEFKIIVEDAQNIEEIKHIANVILLTLRIPYHIQNHEINITTSIGVVIYPQNSDDLLLLDRYMDIALMKAKSLGGNNYQFFSHALADEEALRVEIEHSLPNAIKNNEFDLHFQPQFETLNPDRIVGFEALLRWNSLKLGEISSNIFIPIAERIGVVSKLGEWILKKSCEQYVAWIRDGLVNQNITLSVNISAHQLYKENFVDFVKDILDQTGMPANQLELELTETAIINDQLYAIEIMQSLNDIGVHTIIDDFGSGYTSLSYLTSLPIFGIKIDKSFIDTMLENKNNAIIIQSLIDLAHKINLIVVAEGVEDINQLNYLKEIGCDYIQGYYLSKPLDVADTRLLLMAATRGT